MGNCHCRTENPPVTPARRPFGIAVIGCPTVVIDIAGTGSSPTRVSTRRAATGPSRKTTGPAVPASVLANPDIVLLSHDRHRSSTELGTSSGAHGRTAVRAHGEGLGAVHPRAELRPADVIKARFRAALTPGHLESRKEMSALSNSDLTGSCPG